MARTGGDRDGAVGYLRGMSATAFQTVLGTVW